MNRSHPELTTVVVGAGPAGLLFCALARLTHLSQGGVAEQWPIVLIDKREAYARTHRLRIDPAPYKRMRSALSDARLDPLFEMLDACDYQPVVNDLERELMALVQSLGIQKEQLHVGDGPGQCSLVELRERCIERGLLSSNTPFTIVAADSVHSTIREMVRGETRTRSHTHQQLVRLRIDGDALPGRLDVLSQVRLSRLLNSLLDYRLNRNGFAELDLFLSPEEHDLLQQIDANPRQPVTLDAELLATLKAPLFVRIVRHLQQGFGAGPCKVSLYSSFKLEHHSIEQVVFYHEPSDAHLFLVGDAAVSLPFFRGMAALGDCAHVLAREMAALVTHHDVQQCMTRYAAHVDALVRKELSMVEARGKAIGLLREASRVSAMLPFPIQSLFLGVPEQSDTKGRWTTGLVINIFLAILAASIALLAPILRLLIWKPLAIIWLLSWPVQAMGGYAYYAARLVEPGTNPWIKRVWRVQIIALMVLGTLATIVITLIIGHLAQLHIAISWFLFGIPFIAGMFLFEKIHGTSWNSADLDRD